MERRFRYCPLPSCRTRATPRKDGERIRIMHTRFESSCTMYFISFSSLPSSSSRPFLLFTRWQYVDPFRTCLRFVFLLDSVLIIIDSKQAQYGRCTEFENSLMGDLECLLPSSPVVSRHIRRVSNRLYTQHRKRKQEAKDIHAIAINNIVSRRGTGRGLGRT